MNFLLELADCPIPLYSQRSDGAVEKFDFEVDYNFGKDRKLETAESDGCCLMTEWPMLI